MTDKHDYSGLVERLRLAAKQDDEAWARDRWALCADTIETLTRELAEARAESRGICTDCNDTGITIQTERFCTCHAGNAERLGRDLTATKARLAEAVGIVQGLFEGLKHDIPLARTDCAKAFVKAKFFLAQQEASQ